MCVAQLSSPRSGFRFQSALLAELAAEGETTPLAHDSRAVREEAARVAAEEPFARRFPSRVASRIGHYVVLLLFVLAACIGWQVRARGHGLRRVASYLNLRPHKTLECNV